MIRKPLKPYMRHRMILALGVIMIGTIWVVSNLVAIPMGKNNDYQKDALGIYHYAPKTIMSRRGDIYDCNGTALATSTRVYRLVVEPKNITDEKDRKVTIKDANGNETEYTKMEIFQYALKTYFNVSDEKITELLSNTKSNYVRVFPGYLEYEEIQAYNEFLETDMGKGVVGIYLEEDYKRYYPFDTLACHVLGNYVPGDPSSGSGLEKQYYEEMDGINGKEYGYLDGDMIFHRTVREPINGYNIYTTLDANIQSMVEKEIAEYMEQQGAKNVAVLVMNPNNGEILSMAGGHVFNCNDTSDMTYTYYQFLQPDGSYAFDRVTQTENEQGETVETVEHLSYATPEELLDNLTNEERSQAVSKVRSNPVVSFSYEPGSTFKPFTVAAGLEESVIHDGDVFQCNGYYTVIEGQKPVGCHLRSGHGAITVEGAIAQSCNCALMQIVQKEGASMFYKYEQAFGFGLKTYVDLPGEQSAANLVYSEEQLNPMELATSSFGQGQNVTMIQLGSAFCSLINGGNYYEPHLLKEVVNENQGVIRSNEPIVLRKTISEDTSALMRQYMYTTVEEGTGKRARLEGYAIGGKTGTAEKQPRNNNKYLVSFIGFCPVENPEVMVYVIVDEPNEADQSHSGAASILAHDIFEQILPYMNIFQTNKQVPDDAPIVDEQARPIEVSPEEMTEAPATEAPATEAPTAEAPTAEAPATEAQ